MSTKRQQHYRQYSKAIKELVDAIRAIPTGPGPWSARAAMEDFVQKNLCALVQAQQIAARHGWPVEIDFDPLAFNFKPIGEQRQSFDWEERAQEAYCLAVRSHAPFEDILVHVFTELELGGNSNNLGQHFTPPDLCQLIAELRTDHRKRHPRTKNGLEKVADPTCGAGGLLLAIVSEHYKNGGAAAVANLEIHANDLDPLCSAMTALQLVSSALSWNSPIGKVVITVGNALTMNQKPALISTYQGIAKAAA
jgi:hypothetical protein